MSTAEIHSGDMTDEGPEHVPDEGEDEGDGLPTKAELERAYWIEQQTQTEVGKQFGLGQYRVCTLMQEYGIPARARGADPTEVEPPRTLSIFDGRRQNRSTLDPRVSAGDLSTYQMDLLLAIYHLGPHDGHYTLPDEDDSDAPSKVELGRFFEQELRHWGDTPKRLYWNLRQLEDDGYITVNDSDSDGRAATCHLTPAGVEVIEDQVDWIIEMIVGEPLTPPVRNGDMEMEMDGDDAESEGEVRV